MFPISVLKFLYLSKTANWIIDLKVLNAIFIFNDVSNKVAIVAARMPEIKIVY